MLTPVLHPANNCSATVRLRVARAICRKLHESGTILASDYLSYLAVALPLLGKKSASDLAKGFAGFPTHNA